MLLSMASSLTDRFPPCTSSSEIPPHQPSTDIFSLLPSSCSTDPNCASQFQPHHQPFTESFSPNPSYTHDDYPSQMQSHHLSSGFFCPNPSMLSSLSLTNNDHRQIPPHRGFSGFFCPNPSMSSSSSSFTHNDHRQIPPYRGFSTSEFRSHPCPSIMLPPSSSSSSRLEEAISPLSLFELCQTTHNRITSHDDPAIADTNHANHSTPQIPPLHQPSLFHDPSTLASSSSLSSPLISHSPSILSPPSPLPSISHDPLLSTMPLPPPWIDDPNTNEISASIADSSNGVAAAEAVARQAIAESGYNPEGLVGYYFRPTMEEIYTYFLPTRLFHGPSSFQDYGDALIEFDLYNCGKSPDQLFGDLDETESFYLFTPLTYKSEKTIKRAVDGQGTWSAKQTNIYPFHLSIQGVDTKIGTKKLFKFQYKKDDPRKDDWIMHEYTLHKEAIPNFAKNYFNIPEHYTLQLEDIAFCAIHKKVEEEENKVKVEKKKQKVTN